MLQAEQLRVLLADDHTLVRQGLRSALEAFSNIKVVGEVADGEAAVLSALKLKPCAIVMDINMPRMDGIAATLSIKKQLPQIAIVGLSVNPKEYQVYAMLKSGAFRVLNKECAVVELYEAVQEAVAAVRPILVAVETSGAKTATEETVAQPEISKSSEPSQEQKPQVASSLSTSPSEQEQLS